MTEDVDGDSHDGNDVIAPQGFMFRLVVVCAVLSVLMFAAGIIFDRYTGPIPAAKPRGAAMTMQLPRYGDYSFECFTKQSKDEEK